uniref:Putative secreted protein n=1 Tax=Rhipicephalus microplus TaxID=6941 RepID=A0A6G5A3G2_RHIMP
MRTVTLCNLFCFVHLCLLSGMEKQSELRLPVSNSFVCTVAFSFGNLRLISESTLLWLKVQGLLILSSKPACHRRRPMKAQIA